MVSFGTQNTFLQQVYTVLGGFAYFPAKRTKLKKENILKTIFGIHLPQDIDGLIQFFTENILFLEESKKKENA